MPDPVEPITAVVWPGLAVKLISQRTSLSAPLYLKETFSKTSSPFNLSGLMGFSGSWILVSVSSISDIRFKDTAALGNMIKTIETIRKDIIICIAYWINAIISPTCRADFSI